MKGKQRSLNGLFWRYLLSTMALLAGVLLALWFVLLQLIRMGAVLPADTGARNLERTTVLLQAQETFDPGEIPFYYRWALADSSGILESNLSPKEETWAQKVLAGEVSRHGFLYTKYYWSVPLSGGRVCLLQYDYAVCYANPTLQERLPDFQLLFFLVCLGCLVLVALWRTHHYTKGLRRDAQAITLACNGVAQQTLDTPFPAQAQVRELQAALTALDTLRRELAASLQDQWAGEQQKQALLAALPGGCRLVLVGDPHQLPSVGPGNLLSDLLRSRRLPTLRLTEIFRQAAASAIIRGARAVDQGDCPVLVNDPAGDFFFLRRLDPAAAVETIVSLCQTRLPQNMGISPDQIQVLSPTRKGTAGTAALNRALQEAVNPPAPDKQEKSFGTVLFREGDRVMQVKNNYDILWEDHADGVGMGIFNGDIGRIESIDPASGLVTVDFDGHRAAYPPDMMTQLELAYAVTVHKAQGSEYRAVILSAVEAAPMLLTRGILYTAMTRAKELLILVGDDQVVARMAANDRQQRRYSGLRARLARGGPEKEENHGPAPISSEPALPTQVSLL